MTNDWSALLIRYWGYCSWIKSKSDVDDAVEELQHDSNFGRRYAPDRDELCAAIRHLAGPEGHQSKCPTLRDIIIAVRVLRKQSRTGAGSPLDATDSDPESIQAAMTRMHDHESRWDWLCDHVRDLQTADAIKDWAEDRWPGFVNASIEYKREMMRRHGSAWRVVFSGPQHAIEAPRRDVARIGGAS